MRCLFKLESSETCGYKTFNPPTSSSSESAKIPESEKLKVDLDDLMNFIEAFPQDAERLEGRTISFRIGLDSKDVNCDPSRKVNRYTPCIRDEIRGQGTFICLFSEENIPDVKELQEDLLDGYKTMRIEGFIGAAFVEDDSVKLAVSDCRFPEDGFWFW